MSKSVQGLGKGIAAQVVDRFAVVVFQCLCHFADALVFLNDELTSAAYIRRPAPVRVH